MGAVYRAKHRTLGRPAAVKVLLPQFSVNPDIVSRFFNEAKAATAIQHPGIVEVYDYGSMPDGAAYIAMELLRGESLAHRIRRGLDVDHALSLTRSICSALQAAHERGIVHRDLKPDNVFIIPDPDVPGGERTKLLDFGIAKLVDDVGGMAQKTRTGSIMGTPAYMAPEQCRGVPVDSRADLYALGCMLFEMVVGSPPFRGDGVGDLLAAHMLQQPPPLPPAVHVERPGLADVVERLLAKQPDARYASAADVVAAIVDVEDGNVSAPPAPAQLGSPMTAMMARLGAAPRAGGESRKAIVVTGVGLVGAVVGYFVWCSSPSYQRQDDPERDPAAPAIIPARLLSPAETTEIGASVKKLADTLDDDEYALSLAITPDALARVLPSATGCEPHRFSTFHVFATGKPIHDAVVDSARSRLTVIAADVKSGTASRAELETVRGLLAKRDELDLFIGTTQKASFYAPNHSFTPGVVSGTAYVYSHDTKRMVCVARLDVESSDKVVYRTGPPAPGEHPTLVEQYQTPDNPDDAIERDFQRKLATAMAELRVVQAAP
jgi:hypothetical protein